MLIILLNFIFTEGYMVESAGTLSEKTATATIHSCHKDNDYLFSYQHLSIDPGRAKTKEERSHIPQSVNG